MELSRRDLLGGALGGSVCGLSLGLTGCQGSSGAELAAGAQRGGAITPLPDAADFARRNGGGIPMTIVDLAALDQNIEQLRIETEARGWALRPALKSFQSPELCAYVLASLPEPRGMFFHLRTLRMLLPALPANSDLMLGYPPTLGEMREYFDDDGAGEPPHRLRMLIDDPVLLAQCAELARNGRRPGVTEIALEFDSGMQRGGIKNEAELSEAIDILRANQDRLRLTGAMCYDGHATFLSLRPFRQIIAETSQRRYRNFMAQLEAEGGDLFDATNFVRNGPGSSNYQNWSPDDVVNEISPGTAFVFVGYLDDPTYENEGLAPTLLHGAPVMRNAGDGPRAPLINLAIPPIPALAQLEEILLKGGAWPSNNGSVASMVWPEDLREDELSGGRGNNTSAILAPKGALDLGDYVLMRPNNAGDGIDYFGALHAMREGNLEAVWPTFSRWAPRA